MYYGFESNDDVTETTGAKRKLRLVDSLVPLSSVCSSSLEFSLKLSWPCGPSPGSIVSSLSSPPFVGLGWRCRAVVRLCEIRVAAPIAFRAFGGLRRSFNCRLVSRQIKVSYVQRVVSSPFLISDFCLLLDLSRCFHRVPYYYLRE